MIVAAFAGAGKTYFCNHVGGANDFVCMPYKYFMPETDDGGPDNAGPEAEKIKADFSLEMNPEYPLNYINAILENMGKYRYLVIPSDGRVLAGLADKNVPYILCYPDGSAKAEYEKRYAQRGNTEDFIDIFIGNWDYFMEALLKDTYGTHIILGKDAYLLDAKEEIDGIISMYRL
jgi:hypothetical protein